MVDPVTGIRSSRKSLSHPGCDRIERSAHGFDQRLSAPGLHLAEDALYLAESLLYGVFYEKAHSVKGQRGGLRGDSLRQSTLRAAFLSALRLSQSKVARCSMGSVRVGAAISGSVSKRWWPYPISQSPRPSVGHSAYPFVASLGSSVVSVIGARGADRPQAAWPSRRLPL